MSSPILVTLVSLKKINCKPCTTSGKIDFILIIQAYAEIVFFLNWSTLDE